MRQVSETDIRRADERFAVLESHVIRGSVGRNFDHVALCKDLGVALVAGSWHLPTYPDVVRASLDALERLQMDRAKYHPDYPNGPTITYNAQLTGRELRFFMAHELFHHLDAASPKLIAQTDLRHTRTHSRDPFAELLADSFAFELLAPRFLFTPALSTDTLEDLRRKFPLPPAELCNAILSRLPSTDAFVLYFWPTGRGNRLSLDRTLVSFRVRVPEDLSVWCPLTLGAT